MSTQKGSKVERLENQGIPLFVGMSGYQEFANLFVQATSILPQDAEGVHRARSASEAFLYRRLETLLQTAGRFQLNAKLSVVPGIK